MLLPFLQAGRIEAGCDEAGRGCLAGPVFAAAVILPPDFRSKHLNDSKRLSENRRNALRVEIEREAVAWAVGTASPEEIDEINVLVASILAIHRAVEKLSLIPEHLLIDGHIFVRYPGVPHTAIVKGDAQYMSIAAASILAKTHRDDYMRSLAAEYPDYHWETNKGYPTAFHRRITLSAGPTPHHRRSFRVR
jgi:ribonuclease HII